MNINIVLVDLDIICNFWNLNFRSKDLFKFWVVFFVFCFFRRLYKKDIVFSFSIFFVWRIVCFVRSWFGVSVFRDISVLVSDNYVVFLFYVSIDFCDLIIMF